MSKTPQPRKTTPRAVDVELARYKQWVSDLQSKMYVNCNVKHEIQFTDEP